jgi:predicted membrane-bound spermidine synthase
MESGKKLTIEFGVFMVALTTLLFELTMIKIFDVLWYPNLAYMVISLGMFSLGMAGVIGALKTFSEKNLSNTLALFCICFAVSMIAIFPTLDAFRFDIKVFDENPVAAIKNIFLVIMVVTLPFLFSGMVLTIIFSSYSQHIRKLYFFDLVGASIGCLLIVPLLPVIAPEGIIIVSSLLALVAAGLFINRRWSPVIIILAGCITVAPFVKDDIFKIGLHMDKRGIKTYNQKIEHTYWDPISRIDVVDFRERLKWIAFDGGQQTSYFVKFNGDFESLRKDLEEGDYKKHFWSWIIPAVHYLKRDTNQDVLILSNAGGTELKAALMYGAKSVDAIELVGEVVRLGKDEYSDFTGGIFNHPRANVLKGEARSFLRSTNKKYDIIQMLSNHSSSSIAAGSSALDPTYLQTAEAYIEYFSHLKDDGILQINHHAYPKMLITAALAWKKMGKTDFKKHVAVFEFTGGKDNLPTFVVKMKPWTEEEIKTLDRVLSFPVVNPFDPDATFLPDEAFDGNLSSESMASTAYRFIPSTDDRPYFKFHRKLKYAFDELGADEKNFLNLSTALLMNSQIHSGVPMDIIHLYVVGIGAIIFALIVVLVPLLFSKVGRDKWPHKKKVLSYFALLGAGFIFFEIVSIHLFLKLIGYPLYAYTFVVFGYLVGAGIGSFISQYIGITPQKRWWVPFLGIGITSVAILILHPLVFDLFLQASEFVRILITLLMITPLAFFLGMAFPLGVLRLSETPYKKQAIAWAWGINGLFTVIGSFLTVVFSLYFGFKFTLIIAIVCYLLAFILFCQLKEHDPIQA